MTYETSNDPKMRCTKVLLAEGQDAMIDLAYEKVQLQFAYEPMSPYYIYIAKGFMGIYNQWIHGI